MNKLNKTHLRLLFLMITLSFVFISATKPFHAESNNDSPKGKWKKIFNGKNLNGWKVKIKGYPYGQNWNDTFRVIDGKMVVSYDQYKEFDEKFGHIFYKTPYANYKMKLQYRFTGDQVQGGPGWAFRNSGVMIHCQDPETMKLDQNFPVSLEVQLLGGIKEGDARPTGNLCTPGTHVQIDHQLVKNHCINSTSDTYYGDQWVDLEIRVMNDSVISHFINGKEVIKYSKSVIGGDHNDLPELEGTILNKGYISLQSESHPVEFRNIQIMEL